MQTALSFGSTLLSAFTGRKLTSATNISKATTAMRGVSRSMQQQSDVTRAKDTLETYQKDLEDLNTQFKAESDAMESKTDPTLEVFETVTIRPKKTDISVQLLALAWTPYRQDDRGNLTPAW
jgi:phage-related tail protein